MPTHTNTQAHAQSSTKRQLYTLHTGMALTAIMFNIDYYYYKMLQWQNKRNTNITTIMCAHNATKLSKMHIIVCTSIIRII